MAHNKARDTDGKGASRQGSCLHKEAGRLLAGDDALLTGIDDGVTPVADETGCGVFLRAEGRSECHYWSVKLGAVADMERFTACSRGQGPFWMEPRAGVSTGEIPGDTQWLLARRTDGRHVLIVPLIDEALRFCLDGRDGTLRLWADSGDPWTVRREGIGAFVAAGDDPYALQARGAEAVRRRLKTATLRREKTPPDLVDLFGWCTWDAFYREVSAENVRAGLESFRAGGVCPRFLILDDGWLSVRAMPTGGLRLTAFEANEKCPGGLKASIVALKRDFGLARVLAWHAVAGYWAGVDGEAFPDFDVRETERRDLPSFGRDPALTYGWMGSLCAVVPPDRVDAFDEALHRRLAEQGVGGVNVDNQGSLEYSAARLGGRVPLARAYRRAMEKSARRHFAGRLINCMSCSNDLVYQAEDSTLTRTSADFWPARPETHGAHLYINAQVGMWFGQFAHPDWDMFQSGHAMGAYHAAARAISGAPVYVSDKPDAHDFGVLRRLVCADGRTLRCADIARPSPDCLFRDPTREEVLLKIFNFNAHGAVLGVFHARYAEGAAAGIAGAISAADLPGLDAGPCAVLAHRSGELRRLGPGEQWAVRLDAGGWEIFTFAPIRHGRAVLGLADKYNSGGGVANLQDSEKQMAFDIRDAGELALWAERPPRSLTLDGKPVTWEHSPATGKVTAKLPAAGRVAVK